MNYKIEIYMLVICWNCALRNNIGEEMNEAGLGKGQIWTVMQMQKRFQMVF